MFRIYERLVQVEKDKFVQRFQEQGTEYQFFSS